jgi:hypothetical protein
MTVREADCSGGGGNSLRPGETNASAEMTEAASACNSFCELDGSEQGTIGVEGTAGLAQQAGVEQCLKSQPLQQQVFFAPFEITLVLAATMSAPGHARTNPSNRTTTNFITRNVMALINCLRTATSELTSRIPRRKRNPS